MKTLRMVSALLVAILVIAAVAACSSQPTATPPFIINPPPTETLAPPGSTSRTFQNSPTSTAAPSDPGSSTTSEQQTPPPTAGEAPTDPTDMPAYPVPPSPLNADDLGHLPDDPTALMLASLDQPLDQVGRKMAYSHNVAFIPVIVEFMRFQQNEEAQLTLSSFLVRIRDQIPEEELAIVPQDQGNWGYWAQWLSSHPEASPPPGYDGWKGRLFSFIDEPIGAFMYDGVPATIRLEEIVWGGVLRDGIPDLRFPLHLAPEDATYLEPGDRVFGVSINGQHRAYPLRVLNAHEMANDMLGGVQFALAY